MAEVDGGQTMSATQLLQGLGVSFSALAAGAGWARARSMLSPHQAAVMLAIARKRRRKGKVGV